MVGELRLVALAFLATALVLLYTNPLIILLCCVICP